MILTGEEYRASIRDGRAVWIDGERVDDVTTHPAFRPAVDARARIYDLAHEPATRDVMTYADEETGEPCAIGGKLPVSRDDWERKRRAVDTVMDDLRGVVTRVGDETVGRDVVAVRRPGRAQRGRPDLRREHPPPRAPHGPRRSLPRVGQHRPQGRPLEAPAGPGPRHAPARRAGDGHRHRGARRQVRDRRGLRQPGLRQADDRQLGRVASCPTTPSASSATSARPACASSAARASPAATRPRTTRCRTGPTRSTRS